VAYFLRLSQQINQYFRASGPQTRPHLPQINLNSALAKPAQPQQRHRRRQFSVKHKLNLLYQLIEVHSVDLAQQQSQQLRPLLAQAQLISRRRAFLALLLKIDRRLVEDLEAQQQTRAQPVLVALEPQTLPQQLHKQVNFNGLFV
jgi:hypothetical protein